MKEFGIKLRNYSEKSLIEFYYQFDNQEKIYIAPESEHIFEPKEGDIGKVISMEDLATFCLTEWLVKSTTGITFLDKDLVKIIMRQGQQFFAPEIE